MAKEFKHCSKENKMKPISEFSPRSNRPGQYQPMCIDCTAEYQKQWAQNNKDKVSKKTKKFRDTNRGYFLAKNAKDRAAKLQRTPKWLTLLHYEQIEMFYEAATILTKELGILMSVDHIIPLQGKNVSGLHVPWNLQVISKSENSQKRNKV
jgi:hypothetical protein